MKKAFLTGLSGQAGSYLAEFLLEKGYKVGGLIRSISTGHLGNIEHLKNRITLYKGDLLDARSIEEAIMDFAPDEIYNLGAGTHVGEAFERRIYISDINGLGPLRVFNAARRLQKERKKEVRVLQASSSEMYGFPKETPQNEKTAFKPNNPYGIAKLMAHENARILRDSGDLFVVCSIAFNHESPRRPLRYVTRKVSVAVACIANKVKDLPLNEAGQPILNKDKRLEIGNLFAKRDWGFARDYVKGFWLALQQDKPDDYVFATGETHSVKDLIKTAFEYVGVKGNSWQEHVVQVPVFLRPIETGPLCGDASKAKKILGWEPNIKFRELVEMMVKHDLEKFTAKR